MIQFTEKDNSSLCEMAHCIFIIVIIIMNNDASIAITHTSTDCHRSCCISYTTGAPQLSCYTPAIFFTAAILLFCLFVCLENHLRVMTTICYRHMRERSCCPIFQSHPQYIMPLCTYHLPSMLFWLFWASAGAEFAFLTNHPNLHVYW